jgi:hypothetical protein
LAELKVGRGSLLLLLLSMNVLHWDVHIVEEIRVELHCIARGHEDHDLLLQVLLKEGEE